MMVQKFGGAYPRQCEGRTLNYRIFLGVTSTWGRKHAKSRDLGCLLWGFTVLRGHAASRYSHWVDYAGGLSLTIPCREQFCPCNAEVKSGGFLLKNSNVDFLSIFKLVKRFMYLCCHAFGLRQRKAGRIFVTRCISCKMIRWAPWLCFSLLNNVSGWRTEQSEGQLSQFNLLPFKPWRLNRANCLDIGYPWAISFNWALPCFLPCRWHCGRHALEEQPAPSCWRGRICCDLVSKALIHLGIPYMPKHIPDPYTPPNPYLFEGPWSICSETIHVPEWFQWSHIERVAPSKLGWGRGVVRAHSPRALGIHGVRRQKWPVPCSIQI